MHNGIITANNAYMGGGAANSNIFYIQDGEISGNEAALDGGGAVNWGGIYISDGIIF